MDEFAACLDRDTAKIISFNLQKIARSHGKAVIVATTHSDLVVDLSPSVTVFKRFGEEIQIEYFPDSHVDECSLIRELKVEEGNRQDWEKLCSFHYRGHKTSVVRKIFQLIRGRELCGVIVYTYPPPACFGRRLVLPRMSMQEINQKLSTINRIVVHPKYRTVGLGAKLIRESLPLVGTEFVELIAVMAKYSPFAEKAGMKRIGQQTEVKSVVKISQTLSSLGFDVQLLGSQHYVKLKLDTLEPKQLCSVREVLLKNPQPRLKKEVTSSRHMPYGVTADYVKYVEASDSDKLAKLIKTVALLLQTKVYLFWKEAS
jgi:hypothetical protein